MRVVLSEDEEKGPGGGVHLPQDHSLSNGHVPRPTQGHEDARDWLSPHRTFTGDTFTSVTEVPPPPYRRSSLYGLPSGSEIS